VQLAKNSPTTTPKPPKRSKTTPVEPEKNLVVQHNISQTGFQHADELGGLAAPSIAVAHKDKPLTGFGDITLLAHPSLIDPKSKVPVFDADAYTPRQPRAEYKVNESKTSKLRNELEQHAKETGSYPDFHDKIRREGISGALQNRDIRTTLGLAYLKEKGQHHNALNAALEVGAKNRKNQDTGFLDILSSKLHPYKDRDNQNLWDEQGDIHKLIEEAGNDYASKLKENYKKLGDPKAEEWAKNDAQDQVSIYKRRPISNVLKEVKEASKPALDKYTYGAKVNEQLDNDPEFNSWAEKKLAPLQSEKYLPKYSEYDGSLRKLPYTMTNILKTMKLSKLKGEEGGMYGLGHIRAAGVKQFRNLDEIKKHGDRLVSPQEMEVHKKNLDSQFHSLVSKIQSETGRKDYGSMDAIALALKDSMGRGKYLHQTFKDNALEGVSPETLREAQAFKQKLLDSPSEYFEAKPKRGVGFHEFKAAAVPDSAPQHVIDRLHRHGLTTEKYKSGDTEDRKRVIQKLAQEHDLMLSEKEFFTPLERIRKYMR